MTDVVIWEGAMLHIKDLQGALRYLLISSDVKRYCQGNEGRGEVVEGERCAIGTYQLKWAWFRHQKGTRLVACEFHNHFKKCMFSKN
jgi:hypothetical protein